MQYGIEHWVSYILAMEIFIVATIYLVVQYRAERTKWSLGFAYPSPGLLFITSIYTFFILSGFFLWNFEVLGQDFRERFGYGTEYYVQAMMAGLLAMSFGYSGYKSKYYSHNRRRLPLKCIINAHNQIVGSRLSYPLALFLVVAGIVFTSAMGELSSVGYGDGNYAEKLADPRVKIIALIIDLISPALSVMWYLAVIRRNRRLILLSFIVTLSALMLGLGRASLFGILGYLIPIVCIYFYRNLLPGIVVSKRINIIKIVIVVTLILLIALLSKSATRMLINFGVERNLIDFVLNLDLLSAETSLMSSLVFSSIEGLLKEISGIDIVSLINARHLTGVELEYGGTYLLLVTSLLPSLLFLDKPETTLATWYANNYWFTQSELIEVGEGVQANIFHLIGETYINFGSFSLLIIPLVFYIYGSFLGWLMKFVARPHMMFLPIYLYLVRILHEVVMTLTTVAAVFSSVVKQAFIVAGFIFIFCSLLFIFRLLVLAIKKAINEPCNNTHTRNVSENL